MARTTTSPYKLLLVKDRPYTIHAKLEVMPQSGNQEPGVALLPAPDPGRQINISADTIGEDFVFPVLPDEVVLSGQVTGPDGEPVEGGLVISFSQNLTGVDTAIRFERLATTDANGEYTLTVLSGVDYELGFFPGLFDFQLPAP